MDINLIKRLIKIVEQSEVTEFSVQEGDLKIKISKNSSNIPHVQYQHVSQAPVPTEVKVDTGENVIEKPAATSTKLHEIKSPIVGTFYRAPSPDAEPYVQVGDSISKGTILCIVEAMKLMNEIESDVDGKIVKILVENGTPVEYNQPLFLVEEV
ncbi:MAG: acetyl-CoA carboxylase biotin carboxyl carrier protein [Ignavibacteriales bacterium]|jgi:acetyl-CoA carboxylase biotin carboxyl carrier protein|nr:acetyl-CoA carboxylase biotin carboxyl carrier protein [Ignavibacteriales bacterium]